MIVNEQITDEKLLKYYLDSRQPEAYEWNISPQNLYIESTIRDFVQKHLNLFPGIQVCNVGIGSGEWDDFLGFWLNGMGQLTSIDKNKDICDIFRYRQSKENHPNPSKVICEDVLFTSLDNAQFDIVTVIGSTVKESGAYDDILNQCFNLVKKDGRILYMDFVRYHHPRQFENYIYESKYTIEKVYMDNKYPELSFYIFLAGK
ncbi:MULTISPECIES: class I SAM-dependent methyltransferase [Laceyella]|uniref:Class I SAM-dependent methyltransferase n=2 Tax=Laceyella TaxID=292635 RepID=A0ABY5U442_LACSH|nr:MULTISPECIES: class I SAM-dependent methyltransferase [Laceyella]PRZ16324.1 ubiE/COQ5 methyltransferase-like protein [Laceyella sediminis]UWE03410.1 class I SAM-dependent methyltransferase [Laceyella sacchari]